jgi:histidinol-phosphate/aromatic aminotransferase/cobyric acid decarboxylase-like protein
MTRADVEATPAAGSGHHRAAAGKGRDSRSSPGGRVRLTGYSRGYSTQSKGPPGDRRACFVRGKVARPEGVGRAETTTLTVRTSGASVRMIGWVNLGGTWLSGAAAIARWTSTRPMGAMAGLWPGGRMLDSAAPGGSSGRIAISFASTEQREAIYRMRHAVYAEELAQHETNASGRLVDALDAFNHYLAASIDDHLVGFVSITPPGYGRYSIDKYAERSDLPFPFDDGLFEIRILTVDVEHRGSPLAGLLMYASLRWVEDHGGTRVVIIGRTEVADLYERVGMHRLGRSVTSGAVTFELMTATVAELRERLATFSRSLRRLAPRVTWSLTVPFERPVGTFHGGASHEVLNSRSSVDQRRAIISADVLDAWFPPAPGVRDVLTTDVDYLTATSPPTEAGELRQAIAGTIDVDPGALAMGAGLSDLIFRSLPRWVAAEGRALLVEPQYGEYRHVIDHLVGCRIDAIRFDPGDAAAVSRLPDLIPPGDYDLVVLVDPNNPLGYRLESADIRHMVAARTPSTRFWIDRTYALFDTPDRSLERFAAASPNVVVGMSMSKAYALSGLRLGYLCGPADLMADIRRMAPPWGVSRPAVAAGLAAIADPDYYATRYHETSVLREELRDRLAAIPGLRPREGAANFVLVELDEPLDAATIRERCAARGLYLRAYPSDVGLRWHALRVAVCDRPTQQRMMEIIAEVTEETRQARRVA